MTKTLFRTSLAAALIGTFAFTGPALADRIDREMGVEWTPPQVSVPQQVKAPKQVNVKHIRKHDRGYNLTTRETLNLSFRDRVQDETLPLRQLFELDRDYRGQKLEKVIVRLNPGQTRARLRLLVNGRAVDHEIARHDRTVVLDPRRALHLGEDIRSLKLRVDGRAAIRGIEIELSDKRRVGVGRHADNGHRNPRPIAGHASDDIAKWLNISFKN